MDSPLTFATRLAQKTGDVLLKHFHNPKLQTRIKADRSVVTEADLAADHLITETIREYYPDDLLLSEELQPKFANDKTTLDRPVWIIDPLDGTTNFSIGLHYWGVLLARLVDGWPDTAVLYFPLVDEMYTAQRDLGAFLNGKRIQVQPPDASSPRSFFACCSRTFRHYHVDIPYKIRILGSAAYTLCTVARGIAVLGFEATPKIWDIAAAWLLVNEAGGLMTTLNMEQPFPLSPKVNFARYSYPTLAAATPDLATKASQQIKPK